MRYSILFIFFSRENSQQRLRYKTSDLNLNKTIYAMREALQKVTQLIAVEMNVRGQLLLTL